jgi:hypothetical protein
MGATSANGAASTNDGHHPSASRRTFNQNPRLLRRLLLLLPFLLLLLLLQLLLQFLLRSECRLEMGAQLLRGGAARLKQRAEDSRRSSGRQRSGQGSLLPE